MWRAPASLMQCEIDTERSRAHDRWQTITARTDANTRRFTPVSTALADLERSKV